MITKFIYAKNQKEMDKFSSILEDSKFKVQSEADNFVYLRKNNRGNIFVHIAFILIAFFIFPYAIFVNLVYFLYNFYVNSIIIFVTTETLDKDGEEIEFSNFEDLDIFGQGSNENRDMIEDVKTVIRKSKK